MRLERHVLADRSARLPMPDRGGRLFDTSDRGETIDVENAFWAERIRAGELVKAASETPPHRRPSGATSPPDAGERSGGKAADQTATAQQDQPEIPAKRKGK